LLISLAIVARSLIESSREMSGKEPLANPEGMRSFSDRLDKFMGWEGQYKDDSRLRGFVHGVWHDGAGLITGNPREHERANEQYKKVTRPPSPPAKN
jgi:hypothetical protein